VIIAQNGRILNRQSWKKDGQNRHSPSTRSMARGRTRQEQELLAPDVARGTYFFLDVAPRSQGRVRVALGGREKCGQNYLVERASYPFPTLEYVAEGLGEICYDGAEPLQVRPGALFAHGPGVKIRMQGSPGSSWLKYFLCFTGRGARALIEQHAPVFGRLVTVAPHAELRELFELLIREGGRHTPFTRSICDHLGRLLLLKISEARRHRGGKGTRHSLAREKFLRCKTLIDEEGGRFTTLEQISEALRSDPSGLNRLFRRYQGVSPYQYLLRHKMNLAAQDLIRTGDFVKEVASRAGYADAYHFSRVFKAVHGIAPAHFPRRSARSAAGR